MSGNIINNDFPSKNSSGSVTASYYTYNAAHNIKLLNSRSLTRQRSSVISILAVIATAIPTYYITFSISAPWSLTTCSMALSHVSTSAPIPRLVSVTDARIPFPLGEVVDPKGPLRTLFLMPSPMYLENARTGRRRKARPDKPFS
jgi:hypothetical protein